MWSTKVLDDVRKLFPNDNNGSRILITTRLADVAAYANSSMPSYEMRLMDADQSWKLLRLKVFANHDIIPLVLENIGKEIARSCRGLPLAVVVVAGVLSTVSNTRTSWEEISRNIKTTLATRDGQIEKILSLSYNHLPHHLRQCFLYMGGFPEDHQIKVMDLMRLWIAEGFVSEVASKSFEDSAEEYMKDLIKRSLIVASKSKSTGKIKHCSLHDLVRNLCIKLCQEEKFLVHVKDGRAMKSMKNGRRISISHSDADFFANNFSSRSCSINFSSGNSSTIRTIMYFQDKLGPFRRFRLLRVIDMLRVGFKSRLLPDYFFELLHLRYLAFCYGGQIPRAISNLKSLQTLIIKRSYNSKYLPCEIWNMVQLRHLGILSYCYLALPSIACLALPNLQTLGKVKNLTCSVRILHMVSNLTKLSLTYSWGTGDLLFHNLIHLHRLEKLKLELTGRWSGSGVPNLVLPSSLIKLVLIGWGRSEPYINIAAGSLPNLQVLKLREFSFMLQEWITSDQHFSKLRFLLIENSNLKQWKSQGSHFPMLEDLLIHSCPSLSEIPTLRLIEVKDCKKSLAESVKLIQEEQQSYGDDVFQVRCINCEPLPPPSPSSSREMLKYVEHLMNRQARKQPIASGMHGVRDMLRNARRPL